jgi:predicted histone-like DNA-binding protein
MILYVLKQNKNSKSAAFGKWFAFPVIEETIDLDALAEHMSNHNTPYSKGAIKGMLTDMVSCIKELLLEGKNVKIADLAIFSLGIKNNGGAVSEDVFTVSKNIKGVKLRARATGELIAKSLNLEATLKKASATSKTSGNGGSNGGGTTPTGGDSNTGGSQNQGGSGSSQSGSESQNGGTNGGTNGGSQSGGSGSNTGSGTNGSGSNTGGNSGSQSGTEQGQEGDYRLVIYKYGNGTSTVTDDSEQEINSNDQVHSGSNVNISVVPAGGKEPLAKVNGIRIALTENDGTYTGSFVMPTKGTVLEINSEPSEWDYADEN